MPDRRLTTGIACILVGGLTVVLGLYHLIVGKSPFGEASPWWLEVLIGCWFLLPASFGLWWFRLRASSSQANLQPAHKPVQEWDAGLYLKRKGWSFATWSFIIAALISYQVTAGPLMWLLVGMFGAGALACGIKFFRGAFVRR